MGDLAVNSSLLIAASDLKMVQGVLQAIRVADLTGAAERAGRTGPAAAAAPSCDANRAAVRTVVQTRYIPSSEKPAATFEPCPVHHWHTRLNELQPYTADRPVLATECKPGIQPPWKVLPWPKSEKPIHARIVSPVKIPAGRVDTDNIGRTLDLFV